MSVALEPRSDDYIEFCSFLRELCGIDLTQYKRPQMERRLRAFYRPPRASSSLTDSHRGAPPRSRSTSTSCSTGSRSTSRSCGATRSSGSCIETRPAAGARPGSGADPGVERRLLVRRRGLHAGDALPPRRSAGQHVTMQGTDIDKRMVAKRAARRVQRRGRPQRARRSSSRPASTAIDGGWRAKLGAALDDAVRRRRSAAGRRPGRTPTT